MASRVFCCIVLALATCLAIAEDTVQQEAAPEIVEGSLRGSAAAAAEQVADGGVAEKQGDADVEAFVAVGGGHCRGQPGWARNFQGNLYTCGLRTGGEAHSAGRCMAQVAGVSGSCGRCLGYLIQCSRDHCIQACCAGRCPSDGSCTGCNRRHCSGAFQACAGVSPP